MRKYISSLVCLLLLTSPLLASEGSKAAEELMVAMNMKKVMRDMAGQATNLAVQINPGLSPYREILDKFYAESFTTDEVYSQMRSLYEKAFTADELRELAAFYRKPLGTKALKLMPELFQKGAAIGQQAVQKRLPELMSRLKDAAAKTNSSPEK